MGDVGNDGAETATRASPSGVPAAPTVRTTASERLGLRSSRRIVWLVLCLVAVGFVAFGRVTVYVADGDERRLSILRVWSLLGEGLPRVGHASLLSAVFVSALLVMIVTSLAALWLALVSVGPSTVETASQPSTNGGEAPAAAEGAAVGDRP